MKRHLFEESAHGLLIKVPFDRDLLFTFLSPLYIALPTTWYWRGSFNKIHSNKIQINVLKY